MVTPLRALAALTFSRTIQICVGMKTGVSSTPIPQNLMELMFNRGAPMQQQGVP
jgi:hypothetical protein